MHELLDVDVEVLRVGHNRGSAENPVRLGPGITATLNFWCWFVWVYPKIGIRHRKGDTVVGSVAGLKQLAGVMLNGVIICRTVLRIAKTHLVHRTALYCIVYTSSKTSFLHDSARTVYYEMLILSLIPIHPDWQLIAVCLECVCRPTETERTVISLGYTILHYCYISDYP